MSQKFNRRSLLAAVGVAAAGSMASFPRRAKAAAQASILDTSVISQQPTMYHGWPTLARRANGELLVVCSGARESHVCPFGRVELIRSSDDGRSWSWPRTLMDGPIDDRDAGLLVTAKGTILVTTFTSLAYESILARGEKIKPGEKGVWDATRLKSWQAAHNRISAEQRKQELGVWMIRSTDGGVNWSRRFDCLVDSPHGPIQISDGRLLYVGKELWKETTRIGVCQSTDDGKTWSWLAEIPTRKGDKNTNYHELHAVEAADGKLIAQVRNHNPKNKGETLQAESTDGGKTWTEPKSIGVWGLPSHLLRLSNDRLLMTYGHRRKPLGNQARVSNDNGQTWSEPMIISGDGVSGDLGYPSTVQRDDGSLLTVWYENMKASPKAVLRQATWKLVG